MAKIPLDFFLQTDKQTNIASQPDRKQKSTVMTDVALPTDIWNK